MNQWNSDFVTIYHRYVTYLQIDALSFHSQITEKRGVKWDELNSVAMCLSHHIASLSNWVLCYERHYSGVEDSRVSKKKNRRFFKSETD